MRKIFTNLLSVILIGIISGVFSGTFLFLLEKITNFRTSHSWIIFLLPIFGFLYKKSLNKLPDEMSHGMMHILESRRPSLLLAPFIFLASLGTHLFGGSAGREGVGVIMGASSSQVFKRNKDLKEFLIPMGMACGFASIFGTPLAGIVFCFELEKFKTLSLKKFFFISLSAYVSHFISGVITHHTPYPEVMVEWGPELITHLIASSLAVIIAGYLFFEAMKKLHKVGLNIFWVSILIVGIVFLFDAEKYTGLGLPLLQESLTTDMGIKVFFYKFILTVLTLSVGYKGGEVTPLFIMGANFSTFISNQFGLKNITLSGGLGMLGLFGALAHTPFAAGFMALEIFNWETAILVFITSFIGRAALRKRSIYH